MAFKDELRIRREALGMKQYDLAYVIGACPSTIYKWESGSAKPSLEYLVSLAKALGVSEADLLRDEPIIKKRREFTNVL